MRMIRAVLVGMLVMLLVGVTVGVLRLFYGRKRGDLIVHRVIDRVTGRPWDMRVQ